MLLKTVFGHLNLCRLRDCGSRILSGISVTECSEVWPKRSSNENAGFAI